MEELNHPENSKQQSYQDFFADKDNKMLRLGQNGDIKKPYKFQSSSLDYEELQNEMTGRKTSFSLFFFIGLAALIYYFRKKLYVQGWQIRQVWIDFKKYRDAAGKGKYTQLSSMNQEDEVSHNNELSRLQIQPDAAGPAGSGPNLNSRGYPTSVKTQRRPQQPQAQLSDGDPNDHSVGFKFTKGGRFNAPRGRFEESASSSEWSDDQRDQTRKKNRIRNPYVDSDPEEGDDESGSDMGNLDNNSHDSGSRARIDKNGRVVHYHDDETIRLNPIQRTYKNHKNRFLGSQQKDRYSSSVAKSGSKSKSDKKSSAKAQEIFSGGVFAGDNPAYEDEEYVDPYPYKSTSKPRQPSFEESPEIDRTEMYSHSVADKSLGKSNGSEPERTRLL